MPLDVIDDIMQSVRDSHRDKSAFHQSLVDNYTKQSQKYEEMIENAYEDKLSRSITESYYEKTRDKLRAKQKALQEKLGKLQIDDEEYYLTSNYILDLAKRAPDLYESSEPIEKRQLLKFALQNLELEGSLACYDEVKPFDAIRKYTMRQTWLRD